VQREEGCRERWIIKPGVESRKEHGSKHGRHPTAAPLIATPRGSCLVYNEVTSCSDENKHPDKRLISQAFPRMSPGDIKSFVCARQAAAAGVSGGSSSLHNLYSKHDWLQRERVHCGCAALTSYALSPSWSYTNAACDSSRRRGAASGSRQAGRTKLGCQEETNRQDLDSIY